MERVRRVSFESVEQEWRRADSGRTGGDTVGLLIPLRGLSLDWWSVHVVSWEDLGRVLAIHSNRANGETNSWDSLSKGSYSFERIAESVDQDASCPAAKKIRSFGATPVTWSARPVCVTENLERGSLLCLDGCNRLSAAFLRKQRNQEQELPVLLVGEGIEADSLRILYGFELASAR